MTHTYCYIYCLICGILSQLPAPTSRCQSVSERKGTGPETCSSGMCHNCKTNSECITWLDFKILQAHCMIEFAD